MSDPQLDHTLVYSTKRKKMRRRRKDDYGPITSYGIIAYTKKGPETLFLLYQRRDNFEYMDFLRGVWSSEEVLPSLFSSMTKDERKRIREYTFRELWDDLWVEHNTRIFRDGFSKAKRKYESVRRMIPRILDNTESNIKEPPWGFPKGKKNNFREPPKTCAIREFNEETRLEINESHILNDTPYIETFQGSNNKNYCTHYYLAEIPFSVPKEMITPQCIRKKTISEEASNVEWFPFEEACNFLNFRRQMILTKAMNYISQNS